MKSPPKVEGLANRMNAEPSLRTIFSEALEVGAASARARYLDQACGKGTALRRQVQALLEAHEQSGGFLPGQVAGGAERGADCAGGESPGGKPRIDSPLEEAPGTYLGRYKLREKLGEGGWGVVYVADQEEPVRRRVALKVIKPGMDTRQVIGRFEAERQALAMMDHPNIAKVFDAGATDSGRSYFVMELVRGIRITDYCDQNRLDTTQRLDLFIQVCNAVQHAHQKGIIHRDLKPSNILVTLHDGTPVPKVIDFGIAKSTEGRLADHTAYTQLHQFVGTPAYMSPEQVELSGLDIDTRSDIYSLGVLLYELLTGDTPFDAKELLRQGLDAIRRTVREVEPPRPSARFETLPPARRTTVAAARRRDALRLRSELRGDLDWIVMKCLEKDRTRRFETAHALALDLTRFLRHEPVTARPPTALYRLRKLARRNQVSFAAGVIALLSLVIGLGISTRALVGERAAHKEAERARGEERFQRVRAEAGELAARRFAYASDMNLVQQALGANNLGRAREILHRNHPQPGQVDLRGWEWCHLWQCSRSSARLTLCEEPMSVLIVAYTDGDRGVVTRDSSGAVKLWDLLTRRPAFEARSSGHGRALAVSANGRSLAWDNRDSQPQPGIEIRQSPMGSPLGFLASRAAALSLALSSRGDLLAAFCEDRTVRVWSLTKSNLVTTLPASRMDGMHKGVVLFAPDGALLATGETDGTIRVFDAATLQEQRRWTASREGITALAFSPDGGLLASGSGFSDPTVRLWEVASGRPAGTLAGHDSWVAALAFAPAGKSLASASGDQTVRVWDVASHRQVSFLRGHQDEVYSLAWSADGRTLLSGSKDGAVNVWDATLRLNEEAYTTLPTSVVKFGFLPNSQGIVTLSRDLKLTLWNLGTGEPIETIATLGVDDGEISISPDGKLLAVGDKTGAFHIWDLPNRKEVAAFGARAGQPLYVKFLPDSQELLTVDGSGVARRWRTGSWTEAAAWQLGSNANAVCLTPNGQCVASGHLDGTVRTWSVETGRELATVAGHRRRVTGLAFTPDGGTLATASEDALVKLWDPATLREVATLRGHLLGVHSVQVSPDGRRLASGSHAKEAVKLWDLATRQEIATLEGRGSFFYRTLFSPDGRILAAVNLSGELHLWRTPSLADIEAIETTESPTLSP